MSMIGSGLGTDRLETVNFHCGFDSENELKGHFLKMVCIADF